MRLSSAMNVPSEESPEVRPLNLARLAFSAIQVVACLTGLREASSCSIRSISC